MAGPFVARARCRRADPKMGAPIARDIGMR
jgi:hypothetical protein